MKVRTGRVTIVGGPGPVPTSLQKEAEEWFGELRATTDGLQPPLSITETPWLHSEHKLVDAILELDTDLLLIVPVLRANPVATPKSLGDLIGAVSLEDLERLLSLAQEMEGYAQIAIVTTYSRQALGLLCPGLLRYTLADGGPGAKNSLVSALQNTEPIDTMERYVRLSLDHTHSSSMRMKARARFFRQSPLLPIEPLSRHG